MSKHVKMLREVPDQFSRCDGYGNILALHQDDEEAILAAASHLERIEKQLRIARKALRDIPKVDEEGDGTGEYLTIAGNALWDMRRVK